MNCYAVITYAHMADSTVKTGLILFAHGARDARWREPFERLVRKVEAARPDLAVSLAFLELMQPDLATAAGALAARGCRTLRIVPVFLGQGGHVREDLRAAVEEVRARHPDLSIELRIAIGEDEAVLDEIVNAAITGLPK